MPTKDWSANENTIRPSDLDSGDIVLCIDHTAQWGIFELGRRVQGDYFIIQKRRGGNYVKRMRLGGWNRGLEASKWSVHINAIRGVVEPHDVGRMVEFMQDASRPVRDAQKAFLAKVMLAL